VVMMTTMTIVVKSVSSRSRRVCNSNRSSSSVGSISTMSMLEGDDVIAC